MAIQNLVFDERSLKYMREYSKEHDGAVKVAEFLNHGYVEIDGTREDVHSIKIRFTKDGNFGIRAYAKGFSKEAFLTIDDRMIDLIARYDKVKSDMEYNVSISEMPIDYQLKHRRELEGNRILLHRNIYERMADIILKGGIKIYGGMQQLSYILMDILELEKERVSE